MIDTNFVCKVKVHKREKKEKQVNINWPKFLWKLTFSKTNEINAIEINPRYVYIYYYISLILCYISVQYYY